MQPPDQPTTQRKPPPLEPTEIIALAAMKAVGAVFLNPHLVSLETPSVNRANVTFEGCAGSGQILDTELLTNDGLQLPSGEAGRLLESALPIANGGQSMPLGKLLAGAILALLDVRHPGWTNEEGCLGRVELYWGPCAHGSLETEIGGSIGYRRIVTNHYEVRSANGELTAYE